MHIVVKRDIDPARGRDHETCHGEDERRPWRPTDKARSRIVITTAPGRKHRGELRLQVGNPSILLWLALGARTRFVFRTFMFPHFRVAEEYETSVTSEMCDRMAAKPALKLRPKTMWFQVVYTPHLRALPGIWAHQRHHHRSLPPTMSCTLVFAKEGLAHAVNSRLQ